MSDFIVYSIPGSPYGRTVFAMLEEKGAKHRLVPLAPGSFKTEPHISRNPFGKVPVLEHDGFMLYETQAILRYLDRILPNPALTPSDPKIAARMDQAMNISDWYLFRGVSDKIGFERIVKPRVLNMVPDEEVCAAAMPQAHLVIDTLASLLGDKKFLAADQLTLADLLVAPQIDFLAVTPEWAPLTKSCPNLVGWFDRVSSRPSFKATTWERVAEMAQAA